MREYRLFVLFLLLMVGGGFSLSAQKRVVSGKVFDAEQEPMIGVTVQLEGTTKGIISDLNGKIGRASCRERV